MAGHLQHDRLGKLPDLDELGRPKFAYGRVIHEHCPRRATSTRGGLPRNMAMKATASAIASISSAAKGLRLTPAVPYCSSAKLSMLGRSVLAIPASAAQNKPSLSACRC